MAEELRLEASVVDKFSKPLRDLRNRLHDVKTPESVKGMAADFKRIEVAVLSATRSVHEGFGKVLVGLSIPSLTAVASISGVIAAVKGFSAATIELKQFERETGITIGAFKTLKHAASQFGISEDAVGPGLKTFADNLYDFRRRYGETYAFLASRAPDFVKKLRESAPDKALDQALDYLAQVAKEKGPRVAGLLSEKLFGSDVFARFGLRGIKAMREALAAARSHANLSQADEDAAVKFDRNVEELRESFSKLAKKVGQEVAPVFGDMLAKINEFIDKNRDKIGTGVRDALAAIGDAAKRVDWKKLGADLIVIGDALEKIAKFIISTNDPKRYERQRSGGARDEAAEGLARANKRLEEYDKAHPSGKGPYGSLGSSDDPMRRALVGEVQFYQDRLAKAMAQGVKEGMTQFFQQQSFSGGDAGGMKPILASYGGGGDAAEHPAVRALRRSFSRSGGSGGGGGGAGPDDYSTRSAHHHLTDLITAEAKRAGIDPRILEGIRAGESGRGNHYDIGDRNDGGAYGPFQFNMGRGRFGWQFQRDTGLDPRDPKTIPAQVRYMANFIKRQLQKDPHYADGGNSSRLHGVWHGYHGRRDADPRWGDAGYRPNVLEANRKAADEVIARHNGGPVPMPKNMPKPDPNLRLFPPPGSLSGKDKDKGSAPREGNATLHVRIDQNGVIKTRADGGTLFHEMNVSRGRSMISASESI